MAKVIMGQGADVSILLQKGQHGALFQKAPLARQSATARTPAHRHAEASVRYKRVTKIHFTSSAKKCPSPTFPLTLSFGFLPALLLPFSSCLPTPHSFFLLLFSYTEINHQIQPSSTQQEVTGNCENSSSPDRRNGNPTAAKIA